MVEDYGGRAPDTPPSTPSRLCGPSKLNEVRGLKAVTAMWYDIKGLRLPQCVPRHAKVCTQQSRYTKKKMNASAGGLVKCKQLSSCKSISKPQSSQAARVQAFLPFLFCDPTLLSKSLCLSQCTSARKTRVWRAWLAASHIVLVAHPQRCGRLAYIFTPTVLPHINRQDVDACSADAQRPCLKCLFAPAALPAEQNLSVGKLVTCMDQPDVHVAGSILFVVSSMIAVGATVDPSTADLAVQAGWMNEPITIQVGKDQALPTGLTHQ
eukprot:1159304-Pelagomonas_calceolata.AAC.6